MTGTPGTVPVAGYAQMTVRRSSTGQMVVSYESAEQPLMTYSYGAGSELDAFDVASSALAVVLGL